MQTGISIMKSLAVQLLSKQPRAKVCDATGDATSTNDGYKILYHAEEIFKIWQYQ